MEYVGSDQAQKEGDGNDSAGMCQDEYNENEENKLFDIDNKNPFDKAISDGEDDSPDKNMFEDILMMENGGKMDIERTAKKPQRGVSFMAIPKNKLKDKIL